MYDVTFRPFQSHVTNNFVPAHMSEGKKRAYHAGESGSQAGSGSPQLKTQRLATIPYPATPEEHAEMDQAITRAPLIVACRDVLSFPKLAPILIQHIIGEADPEHLDQKYLRPDEAQTLLDTQGGLLKELEEAWDAKEFASIRDLDILQPARASAGLDTLLPESEQASSAAWQTPYVAGAHTSFVERIDVLYSKVERFNYSNHVALIQSSGCGKSRMLHEASHHVHTVIMNFGICSDAFPKSDTQVRTYLVDAETEKQCENRVSCFLASLFRELSKVDFGSPSDLAGYLGYGDPEKLSKRTAFFDGVISEAGKIEVRAPVTSEQSIQRRTLPPRDKTSPSVPRLHRSVERTLATAAKTLIDKLPRQGPLSVKLLLGFDGSSDLADPTKDWDAVEKIRRVFRYLREQPVFGVFLSTSTTGSVEQFHRRSVRDNSSRIQDGTIYQHPPITQVDYDQLAIKLKEGKTLDDATTMDYMLSLGRPLFKTRYDAMKSLKPPYDNRNEHKHESDIVQLAIRKLLNGQDKPSDLHISIAPLATRLPLEFNTLTEEPEQRQVESHMRICLKIDPFADIMYTVAPSEPVLIEAAAQTMGNRETKLTRLRARPVHVLHRFLSDHFLPKGHRAGLACMLLLLLARDMACRAVTTSDTPMRYHTLVRVTDFLTNLFAHGHEATVLDAQAYEGGPSLKEAFRDSWTHCTHFVKVADPKVVNRKFLMRLMARGSGILCDNELGIDAIIPVCYTGKKLVTQNITAIAIKFRNVTPLHNPQDTIFTNMDPNHTGIFNSDHPGDIPIIKLVLSIGTNTPVLTCPPPKHPAKTRSRLKNVPLSQQHFRFFAAGMSHEVFRPIQEEDEAIWREILSQKRCG
ncbi:hypothetical protein JB92DRAFT_2832327 [Gautieria morchelliformis]|nr:hypothetical protein JB92DRAFT_2832327 [Gautieria morchelliformis]